MIRLGIVGAGGIARSHADAIKLNPDCRIVCVADINEERATAMAAEHDARAFTDYKDFDCGEIDAVILNLPHFLHCEVSVYFLEKGVHVLCEKPMANTVEECDRMIEAAKRSTAKLAIGHVQKYYTAAEEVKKIIESKRFGALVMVHETRTKDYLDKRPAWFLSKKTAGGGIAMNLGAHSLDRILFTTGLAVESVHGIATNPMSNDDIETAAHFLIGLSGGVSATITLCGTHVPQRHDTVYYFTNGIAKIEGRDLFVYENGEFVNYGGEYNLIARQLAEFVKLIRGEESAVCTPEYGREIIRILKEVI